MRHCAWENGFQPHSVACEPQTIKGKLSQISTVHPMATRPHSASVIGRVLSLCVSPLLVLCFPCQRCLLVGSAQRCLPACASPSVSVRACDEEAVEALRSAGTQSEQTALPARDRASFQEVSSERRPLQRCSAAAGSACLTTESYAATVSVLCRLAARWHPDKCSDPQAKKTLQVGVLKRIVAT